MMCQTLLKFFAAIALLGSGMVAQGGEPPKDSISQYPSAEPKPNKAVGTFTFETACSVRFSQKAAYPVAAIFRDFVRREVFRGVIPDGAVQRLRHDLLPGTYNVEFLSTRNGANLYEPENNVTFTIDPDGNCVSGPYGADFNVILKRKIEILSPTPDKKVQGDVIHFRWKPIPGVSSYQIAIMPMYVPGHRGTIDVESRPTWTTKTASLDLPASDLFQGKRRAAYAWFISDGNPDDEPPSGKIAQGDSVFLGTGVPDYIQEEYPGDELIDMKHETRFVVGGAYADEMPGIEIGALGPHSPFLKAGILPGQRFFALNGQSLGGTSDVKRILDSCVKGQKITVELDSIMVPKEKRKTVQITVE